jgi:hypothetical protein
MFPNADGTPGNYQIDADGNNVENEGWNLMVFLFNFYSILNYAYGILIG